jgi:hypothetical protein
MSALWIEVADYIRLLQAHDWSFDFSDDHRVWQAGCRELDALRLLQQRVDPTFALWNDHCPPNYRRSAPC